MLTRIRPAHTLCWVVTGTIQDDRAQKLANDFDCLLQTSTSYYSDWATMYLAPKTLVKIYLQGCTLGMVYLSEKHACASAENPLQ